MSAVALLAHSLAQESSTPTWIRAGFVRPSGWGAGSHRAFLGYHRPSHRWIELDLQWELEYGRQATFLVNWALPALRTPAVADRTRVQGDELVACLRLHKGNLAAVARALGTSRTQIHRLLERYGIDPGAHR